MEETKTELFIKKQRNTQRIIRKRTYEESSSDEGTDKTNKTCQLKTDVIVKQCGRNDLSVVYKSSQSSICLPDQRATASLETETEIDKDGRAIFEHSLKIKEELKYKPVDKIYRGLSSYGVAYENKGVTTVSSYCKGPTRAPINIRPTCQWDYQPDVCKDYKETGFCGFGDSCKFLHDRTDYKHGWEIEQNDKMGMSKQEDITKYEINCCDDDSNEELPFKCYICRSSFVNPVMTKCYHYFCEKCALNHYKKNMRCFICNKQTTGIFNPAIKLIKRLKSEQK